MLCDAFIINNAYVLVCHLSSISLGCFRTASILHTQWTVPGANLVVQSLHSSLSLLGRADVNEQVVAFALFESLSRVGSEQLANILAIAR